MMQELERIKSIIGSRYEHALKDRQSADALKKELHKDRPSKKVLLSLIDAIVASSGKLHGMFCEVEKIVAEYDSDTVIFADESQESCPAEVNGMLTKYGVAARLGITVKTVENRQRDHRRGNYNFPAPTATEDGKGEKATHLWSKESIDKYDAQRTKLFGNDKKATIRRKKRKIKPVFYVDGLLTKHGVTKMLGWKASRIKNWKSIPMFPEPCAERRIGSCRFPHNLWLPKDIEAYAEMMGVKEDVE